jgi:alpha-tubulin suppressor-like RCC1 family protein
MLPASAYRKHHSHAPFQSMRPSLTYSGLSFVVVSAAVVLACDAPMRPIGTGRVSVQALAATGNCGVLTGGRVQLRGAESLTVSISPGTTKTIPDLTPGGYTVGLEGLIGTDVDCFGKTPGVQVVAGGDTVVSVMFAAFPPPVVTTLSSTTFGEDVVVGVTAVPNAARYVVEWDTASDFAHPDTAVAAATSTEITVPDTALYHFRARGVNEFGSSGRPSAAMETFVDKLVHLSAGFDHTCATDAKGRSYCWGLNASGQLGNGATFSQTKPTGVSLSGSFATVSAGYRHTCGLTTTGAAYCWGDNAAGELGDGTTTQRATPVAAQTTLTFAELSVGWEHTCGRTAANVAYCWGSDSVGQLGDADGTFASQSLPVLVAGGYAFAAISAGSHHTCGLDTSGRAYCWGLNASGQLGDATTNNRGTPTPVAGGLTFTALTSGAYHTCGLTASGGAYCWGSNGGGALGDSTSTNRTAPVAVRSSLTFAVLSAGNAYTCGVDTSHRAYCWGESGDYGVLGDGSRANRTAPVAVAGALAFAALSAGGVHTCGWTPTGIAYCWGRNSDGELGDGMTMGGQLTPVRVANP